MENSTKQDSNPLKAEILAAIIHAGYQAMLAEFLNNTAGAQRRFEQAAWHDVHQAIKNRNRIYKDEIGRVYDAATAELGDHIGNLQLWRTAKDVYAEIVNQSDNALIAQTFFNSTFGRAFGHEKIRDVQVFICDKKYAPKRYSPADVICCFADFKCLRDALESTLNYFRFELPYSELKKRALAAEQQLRRHFPSAAENTRYKIEFARSLFFRNKAAYVIGRISDPSTKTTLPVALALLNNERGGIYLDAVLIGEKQLSMLLSFTRTHFMVNTDKPGHYVALLSELLPHKKTFELYHAIGFTRHAKTEFYRYKIDFTHQLSASSKYRISPGVKGMVMLVFDAKESDYVYKVIKDRFTAPKDITRSEVIEKYRFVWNSDRAGRMADAHEFNYLAFDLSRFSEELVQALHSEAAESIEISGTALVLKHVYVERKMVPLNLYLKDASDEQIGHVMDEYGKAIKQLAAVNIFPGDMLFKNFGVTRHGRVVFYDYDEICPITSCHFRRIPTANIEEEELSGELWFDTEPNNVFPEQFPLFFSGHKKAKAAFEKQHSDLYEVDYWNTLKQQLLDGQVADIFPYDRSCRLLS